MAGVQARLRSEHQRKYPDISASVWYDVAPIFPGVTQRGLLEPGAPFQQKPFAPEELARTVREMLDAARLRTAVKSS